MSSILLGSLALHSEKACSTASHLTAGHKRGEARLRRQLSAAQSWHRQNGSSPRPAEHGSGVSSLCLRKSIEAGPSFHIP